ncbi:MAG: HAD family phosphatase [Cyclobacteriaceae bacterium]|nr:HAD family phosphatase [Cyclobacteriaceae bacterium]
MKIKNLVFDLGGVIIDLSPTRTVEAFSDLSGVRPEVVRDAYLAEPEFFAYERGEISDVEFRLAVKRILKFDTPDEAFDKAWNAMLVDLPLAKLNLLDNLREQFRVTLLSNTNNIHLDFVNREMLPKVSDRLTLDEYFHTPYYSHLMGKRKPDAAIFQQVLHENSFIPEETLFLDDNPENIQSAARLGIQTFLVKHPDEVIHFFNGL